MAIIQKLKGMKMADNAKPVELTSEELKSVAGGRIKSTSSKKSASFFGNMSGDSKFLNVLLAGRAGCCDRYGVFKVFFNTSEVISAWNSVGIQIGPDNGYYLDWHDQLNKLSLDTCR